VPTRVSPTDRIHRHIDDLFAEDRRLPEILEEVARIGAQLLMQAALEADVTEFLGRDRYARAATAGGARPGSRNRYRDVTVKTTAGPVTLARPKLRGTTGAFASCLFGSHVTKTNALESCTRRAPAASRRPEAPAPPAACGTTLGSPPAAVPSPSAARGSSSARCTPPPPSPVFRMITGQGPAC
jgi:hypothetical protein